MTTEDQEGLLAQLLESLELDRLLLGLPLVDHVDKVVGQDKRDALATEAKLLLEVTCG